MQDNKKKQLAKIFFILVQIHPAQKNVNEQKV